MDRLQAALDMAAALLPIAAVAAVGAVVAGRLGVWSAPTAALAVAASGLAVLVAAAVTAAWPRRNPHKTENRRRPGASNGNAMLDVTSAMPLGTAVTRNGHR